MIQRLELDDDRLREREGVDALGVPEDGRQAWIRVVGPGEGELARLCEVMGIDSLALERICDSSRRPRVEDGDDHLIISARAPMDDPSEPAGSIALVLGANWLVSVEPQRLGVMDEVEARIRHEPRRFLVAPERILHAALDHTVAAFITRLEEMSDLAEVLEEQVVELSRIDLLRDILKFRRELAKVARTVRRQRDMLLSLSRTNHEVLSHRITPYFRDAYDHSLRACEQVEAAKESLAAVRESHLSIANHRLSETMRVLTVIATIMMPLSLVAGIFGMNFEPMPLLHTPYGFWGTMTVMAGVALFMLAWFRRRGWV